MGWNICPVCKEESNFLKKEGVCHNCQGLIEHGKQYDKFLENFDSSEIQEYTAGYCRLNYNNYDNKSGAIGDNGTLLENTIKLFNILVERVSVIHPLNLNDNDDRFIDIFQHYRRASGGYNGPKQYYMKKKIAATIYALAQSVRRFAQSAYNHGVEDGKDLLRDLRNGKMTLQEFDNYGEEATP